MGMVGARSHRGLDTGRQQRQAALRMTKKDPAGNARLRAQTNVRSGHADYGEDSQMLEAIALSESDPGILLY